MLHFAHGRGTRGRTRLHTYIYIHIHIFVLAIFSPQLLVVLVFVLIGCGFTLNGAFSLIAAIFAATSCLRWALPWNRSRDDDSSRLETVASGYSFLCKLYYFPRLPQFVRSEPTPSTWRNDDPLGGDHSRVHSNGSNTEHPLFRTNRWTVHRLLTTFNNTDNAGLYNDSSNSRLIFLKNVQRRDSFGE